MHATFTDQQREIEQAIREIAAADTGAARAALDGGWQVPATDADLFAGFGVLGVPEDAGGADSGLIDLLLAVEVLGESISASRFPWHAAAVQVLLSDVPLDDDLLNGRRVLMPALDGAGVDRRLVPFAAHADGFVVASADQAWIADARSIRVRESLDPALPLADVTMSEPVRDVVALGRGRERATLVLAAQLCGVAQGAIDMAAAQARTREQFGKPIGSFQGVAFQLADAITQRKAAWDLTLYAAWAVETDRTDATAHVHAAKAAAGKAAIFAAERCIQVHGGMGITMAADPHLYLRRALTLDAMLGPGAWHRREVGRLRVAARL